ncbi:MAG: OmpA family protein [Pseudomonadota bacterium]
MRRVILTLVGLIALSLLIFYAAVTEAPRIERNIQAEAIERLNNAGIAGVSVRADGRRLMAAGQAGVETNALRVLRQQVGVQQADWQVGSLGAKATRSTGIHSVVNQTEPSVTQPDPVAAVEPAATNTDDTSTVAGGGGVANTDTGADANTETSTGAVESGSTSSTTTASVDRDTASTTSGSGAWATGLRYDESGLAVSGDSINEDRTMLVTVDRLREIAGDVSVRITAQARDNLPASWPDALVTAATVLKEMGGGNALLSQGQLKVTGLVQDREQEQSIRRALVQLTPPDLSWRTEFTYVDDGGAVEGVSAFVCNANLFDYMRDKKVVFERASTSLSFESFEVLDGVAGILSECPAVRVEVAGFTDARGSLELNNRISQERADTVRLYLVEHGVATSRIMATGYGPQRPIATNDTAEGRALNRRIEFNVFGE